MTGTQLPRDAEVSMCELLKNKSIGPAASLGAVLLLTLSACDYHTVESNGPERAATNPGPPASVVQASATETKTVDISPAESTQTAAVSGPRPKLKPGARTKVLSRAGDRSYDKTFDDLRFDMEVGERFVRSMLTKEIEELDGTKVRIRGFMLFGAQNRGIKQFVLVRDNQECCFGPGAALYDCIFVEMPPGKTLECTRLPVAVEGTFNIREFVVGGRQMAIYQMDAESVK
jgi:hypothetical protein